MRNELPLQGPCVLVSTDSVGLGGDPRRIGEIYENVPQARINGQIALEVLAWKWIPRFLDDLEEQYHVVGFHGQVGYSPRPPAIERAKEVLFNQSMIPIQALFALAQQEQAAYVLLHESAAKRLLSQPNGNHKKKSDSLPEPLLMVENIPQKGSLLRTANLAKTLHRQQPRPVGMMIDVAHALAELPPLPSYPEKKQIQQHWDHVMFWLESILPNLDIIGFHLPIGTTDNVPYNLEKNDWEKLGQKIQTYSQKVRFLVIENQHAFTQFRLRARHAPIISSRTRRILDKVEAAGVLPH